MSMSTFVQGFKPPDEKWRRMKEVYDACESAGIAIPNEVSEFFNGEEPDNSGVEVVLEGHVCCRLFQEDMREGFEIDITKLPKNVTVVRFFNSF